MRTGFEALLQFEPKRRKITCTRKRDTRNVDILTDEIESLEELKVTS